jgi:superfamily II DNA or RNA helicase/HKD family nuclease
MVEQLPPGLYESLLTLGLRDAVELLRRDGWSADLGQIDDALVADILADHVRVAARRSINSIGGEGVDRLSARIDVVNRLLDTLRDAAASGAVTADDSVASDGTVLRELHAPLPVPTMPVPRIRPHISLRESALLVNGHRDYQVGAEVARELESADQVDLLCAFVRFAGINVIRPELEAFVRRGGHLRVIASVYTGSTEKRALDEIVQLGGQVKVSFETDQTRLHAKAWLFERRTGFHTAYIGSSNLTRSALVEGLEWNVRVSSSDNDNIIERVRATFEQYWNDPAFVSYDPAINGEALAEALASQRSPIPASSVERLLALNLDLRPQPHQAQMLEELAAERSRGHTRNLVVAATGTGKTWVSAFDYKRLREQGHERLLFVAHRDEILRQSQLVFQLVTKDASFGQRFVAGERPESMNHVFASIQSLHRVVDGIDPHAWDVVIVDEFHHAEASTYKRLLERLRPRYLIGLTATPERADGESILHWFDDRIACEVRLWQALEQGLLSPFHYFGSHDGTDLRGLTFTRGQYAIGELETTYLSNRERATRILQAVERQVETPASMRALGFCVSVAHAKFMAERFNAAGIQAVALHAASAADDRIQAVTRLRRGDIQAIFTVDLFNEGVDIPEVDTILLLRPTESATIFLQQLGRGLRRTEGKAVLTVLDFIGQAHREYRFDVRYQAMIGGTRRQLARAVEEGFPITPPGCAIRLDRLSQEIVLENLRAATWSSRKALAEDLRQLPVSTRLPEYLRASGRDVADIYARPTAGHSFTTLRAAAFPQIASGIQANDLDRAFGRMLHIDDNERFDSWMEWLAADRSPELRPINSRPGRLQAMLFGALGGRGVPLEQMSERFGALWGDRSRREELLDLLSVLRDRARADTAALEPEALIPLHSHATYTLTEIVGASGMTSSNGMLRDIREGVVRVEEDKSDLFFVTLEKGEGDYSPTTRYEDYPISPTLFHWESQSTTSPESRTGQRYIHHRATGDRIVLFVRDRKRDARGETIPYTCLGFATYLSHESSRPMRVTWELERAMPAGFFQEAKVAAG